MAGRTPPLPRRSRGPAGNRSATGGTRQENAASEGHPEEIADAAGAPKIPSDPQVQKLIDQLGNDKFAEREAAGRRLEALGESAFLALRKAVASSPDPEIRQRAGRVAEAI